MKLACACSHQHWFVGMLGLLVAVFLLDPCKMSYNMHDILCCRLHSTILNRVGDDPMLRMMIRILHGLKTNKEGNVLLR